MYTSTISGIHAALHTDTVAQLVATLEIIVSVIQGRTWKEFSRWKINRTLKEPPPANLIILKNFQMRFLNFSEHFPKGGVTLGHRENLLLLIFVLFI